jgi:hypothetical protein
VIHDQQYLLSVDLSWDLHRRWKNWVWRLVMLLMETKSRGDSLFADFGDPNNSSMWTYHSTLCGHTEPTYVRQLAAGYSLDVHLVGLILCSMSKKSSSSPFFHRLRCAAISYGVSFWAEIAARKLPSSSTTLMWVNSNINRRICLLRQSTCLVWNMTCYFFLWSHMRICVFKCGQSFCDG